LRTFDGNRSFDQQKNDGCEQGIRGLSRYLFIAYESICAGRSFMPRTDESRLVLSENDGKAAKPVGSIVSNGIITVSVGGV
jgi:hypothetical protein